MGRWSASHWKTAIFGWLAFVVASFAIGHRGPDADDRAEGRRRRRGRQGEQDPRRRVRPRPATGRASSWSIQSKTKTVDDPAFRATIDETIGVLSGFEQVEKLRSPLDRRQRGPDLARPPLGPDHASARAAPTTRRRSTSTTIVAADGGRPEGAPGLLRRRGRRLDREGARQGDQRRDREGRADRARR